MYKYPDPIAASYFLVAFFALGAGFLEDIAAFLAGVFFALPPAFFATFFGALEVAYTRTQTSLSGTTVYLQLLGGRLGSVTEPSLLLCG